MDNIICPNCGEENPGFCTLCSNCSAGLKKEVGDHGKGYVEGLKLFAWAELILSWFSLVLGPSALLIIILPAFLIFYILMAISHALENSIAARKYSFEANERMKYLQKNLKKE